MPHSIAVIEPSGRLYGSEFCLLDIVEGLPKQQFDWRVFLPAGQGFDELLQRINIPCEHLIPATLGQMSAFKKAFVYLRVMNRLRQLRPDLLYINQAGSLRAGAVYAKWLGLPVVCQVQTLEDARWLSGRRDLQNVVHAFICNSMFIADQTDVDSRKKCVLYQGMHPARTENTRKNAERLTTRTKVNPDSFIFGILGRMAISKGHYLLIDAVKQLGDRLPESRFVVIGEGLTLADTKAYQDAVAEAGLTERFVFRGYQTNIEEELSAINGLLIPSLAEPLGRVLFDAAEFGVPVVVSDGGGLGEVGKRFDIGVSFTTENPIALADAMVDLAENFDRHRAAFAKAAVSMMERLKMDSYLDVVGKILESGTQRQPCTLIWQGDA
jgi:glycosyltransferase involved in cell wall biosynthesis